MDRDPNASPFLEVPTVVLALCAVMAGLEVLFWAGSAGLIGGAEAVGWRLTAIRDWTVIAPVFDWMLVNRTFPPEQVARLVTYPFIHAGFVHAAFAIVILLAIGKAISGVFAAWRFLVIFWASCVAGALAYFGLLDTNAPLLGAYPGVYGVIGAFTFILWVRAKSVGEAPMRAFTLIGFLLGIQLVFGVLFDTGQEWVADVAGFAAGFGLSFLLVPGGWARIRDALRNR